VLRCPYCRVRLPDSEVPARCPHCGDYIAWLDRTRDFLVDRVDLWCVLRGQRQANVALLLIGIVTIGAYFVWEWRLSTRVVGAVAFTLLMLHIMLANGFHQMLVGFAQDGDRDVGLALLLTLPGVNVPAAVTLNIWTWRAADRIRLPWRPFGWTERALTRAFARTFCHQSGYNLTGNVSGRCPECGTPTGLIAEQAPKVTEP
jgi:predicted RNA-binding Zn-ribbon protein involved in translation (DUF1610 family)